MNIFTEEMDPQVRRILLAMVELQKRRSPYYAEALGSLLELVPPSPDREQLAQHRQDYLASLEAQQ